MARALPIMKCKTSKMAKKNYFLLILLITVTFRCFAWPDIMTLHDCMEYAVSNSTKIKVQQAETGDRRLEIRTAILSAFTPNVSASTSAYYNFGRSIDPQTNTYFNLTSFSNGYSLSASIILFDGFSAVNNIKISKTGLLISQSTEKQIEADICLAVMEAFYNVIYYKNLLEVYAGQIKTAEESLRLAERQEELGLKGYADVVQMEADLADKQFDYINTKNQFQDQLMVLESLIFWDEDKDLQISDELPQFYNETYDEEYIIDYAMNNNPEIKIARWNIDNSKRELRVAKWSLLPTVSLSGGWGTSFYTYSGSSNPGFGYQFKNNRGEYVQLGLSIPLYDRLTGVTNIKKKKHALDKAQYELEQKMMDVQMEIKRAIQDCEGASESYTQALKKSKVQEEAYRLNQKKLEQGLISTLEFQTASNNYLHAKADELNSLFKFLIKKSVVKYYHGIEYINQ